MTWLVVVIGLMLIVFVHELGHFGTALAVGMRPRSFYLGFPPAVVKVKRRGIEYGIGAIPLGGFVRIPGMYRPSGGDLEAFTASAVNEQPSLAAARAGGAPVTRRRGLRGRATAPRRARELGR